MYDASANAAWWIYVRKYFARLPGFSLFAVGQTLTIHLPVTQTLTPAAIRQFAAFRDQILGQIGGSVHHG